MKILMVHNYYRLQGGEDESFEAEAALLESRGHDVFRFTRHTTEVHGWSKLKTGVLTVWNRGVMRALKSTLDEFSADIVHFQNTFPLISPAAYSEPYARGIPIVQSLRNYRLMCINGVLYRGGEVCELCIGRRVVWPGVVYSCFHGSRTASSAVASMVSIHRMLGTWSKKVTTFIANSEFSAAKHVESGLNERQILVKPNFVYPDPGARSSRGRYSLYVGRLSSEKGVANLVRTYQRLGAGRLKIAGDGPMREFIEALLREDSSSEIELLGHVSKPDLYSLIKGAEFVLIPSEWYETFGRVVIEAYACGVPVIASNIGGLSETIEDETTGLLFEPGSSDHLAEKIEWAWAHPDEMEKMGRWARTEYEEKYDAERNYQMLLEIYHNARSYGS